MKTRTPRSRRTVWISVSTAAGLIVFYYYFFPHSPAPFAPSPVTGPATEPGVSRRSATIAPEPAVGREPVPEAAASAPKLAVNGVMIAPASRAAMISVDDRPAVLFVEGQQVADGVVLYALDPGGIVVKRGGELVRLPLRGVQSAGSADAVQSAAGGDAAQSAGNADPAQFTRSPDPVQSAASAGVDLPAWATESVLSTPPSAAEARRAARHHD